MHILYTWPHVFIFDVNYKWKGYHVTQEIRERVKSALETNGPCKIPKYFADSNPVNSEPEVNTSPLRQVALIANCKRWFRESNQVIHAQQHSRDNCKQHNKPLLGSW